MDNEALETEELRKNLTPLNIWSLAVGAIIGFGCFVLPSDFLESSGPVGSVIGLIVGAAAMSTIGWNISFLVKKYPIAGGQFEFAYKVLGRREGFVCGWMLSLCYISLVTMNATALGVLAQYLAPNLFTKGYLYTIAGWDVYLPQIILSIIFIIAFGIFNYRGVKMAGNVQLIMVALLIASVILMLIGTLFSEQAAISNLDPPFPSGVKALNAVIAMVSLAPWLYVGFDTIPTAAEEFSFHSKRTSCLVISSIWAGCLIYIIVILCIGSAMPWERMVNSHFVWAIGETMQQSIGTIGVLLLSVAVIMGICTGMNGFYLAGSRLLLAMSREEILPKWFGNVHKEYKTPFNAIKLIVVVSIIAPFFGRTAIGWIVDMCSCGTAIAYLFSSISALKTVTAEKKTCTMCGVTTAFPILGIVFSILILGLLLLPMTSGTMGIESWTALIVWAFLGAVFYKKVIKQ